MPDLRPTIILVDDDPGMNLAVKRLLKAAGFHVTTFPSAEALLEAGTAAEADCLVIDIHLPGLSGFELWRELKENGAEPPIVFITAYDEPTSRMEAQRAGAIGYFTKPFPAQELLAALSKAVEVL